MSNQLKDYLLSKENLNFEPSIEELRRMYSDRFPELKAPDKESSPTRDLYSLVLHLEERISKLEKQNEHS